MNGNECEAGWVIRGRWAKLTSNMYGVFEFVVHYLIPMVCLIFFYGKVIRQSRAALKTREDTTSAATQKVSVRVCLRCACRDAGVQHGRVGCRHARQLWGSDDRVHKSTFVCLCVCVCKCACSFDWSYCNSRPCLS